MLNPTFEPVALTMVALPKLASSYGYDSFHVNVVTMPCLTRKNDGPPNALTCNRDPIGAVVRACTCSASSSRSTPITSPVTARGRLKKNGCGTEPFSVDGVERENRVTPAPTARRRQTV